MKQSAHALRRRDFLAAGAAPLLMSPQTAFGSEANSAVRLGLIGCGGRGVGVASSFVKFTGARVTALADLFRDQADKAKEHFDEVAREFAHAPVDRSQIFVGPRAFEQLANSSEVDLVQIATPIYFHPEHFEAAVAAGKHIYLEKPVAVDMPGVRRVLEAAEQLKGRRSVTVGLQLRYSTPYAELMRRVHDGRIGPVVSALVTYLAGALNRPERPDDPPAEARVRNWVWDRRLSGDIVVEQNVHVIDMTNWALRTRPTQAYALAGRAGRGGRGDCSSHYNCVFSYPAGIEDIQVSFVSTQFVKGGGGVEVRLFGQDGTAIANYGRPVQITGSRPWTYPGLAAPGQEEADSEESAGLPPLEGALRDADENKQKALIESIKSGHHLFEVDYGCESTVTAILARTAAERREPVTWEEIVRSNEVWDPGVDITRL
jgi:myo-inositol 2-dehydrogenase / D-chiro-inositol 1-dehydrogenase